MDILGFIPINIASNSKYFLASRERYVGGMGGRRGPYRVLVGIPDRKWPLVRSRRRWDDNIKMYLQYVGRKGMDCIPLAQDWDRKRALVNAETNLRVP